MNHVKKVYNEPCMNYVKKLYIEPCKESLFVCLFDSLHPINNLSVKQGQVFLD